MATILDFYQILDLDAKRNGRHISPDELRQAYKRALLFHHPDKQGAAPPKSGQTPAIDDIAEAYRVLGDAKLRAEYDRELQNSQEGHESGNGLTRHTGMETADLEDLDFDELFGIWSRPCRCGSTPAFVVNESELEKNVDFGELITGCKGCSLWLKVFFSVED